MSDGLRWANGLDERPERKPIPVDPEICAGCGHEAKRCHDGRGCGKWVEASIGFTEPSPIASPIIVRAHTCPCAVPYGKLEPR